MRILASENFPGAAAEALRARGHDVLWARTECPGSPDKPVADLAGGEGRLLVTFDKDSGERAFRQGLHSPAGIVLFRVTAASPAGIAELAVAVPGARNDWAGHFSVREEGRVRMTPLPPTQK